MNDELTPEQKAAAAEQERLQKEAEKAEAKRLKDEQKAQEKADREAKKAQEKADKLAAKENEKKLKEQAKLDAAAAKEQAKTDAAAAKEAQRMPEQNGVRRPKPETLCGQAWAIFDAVSAQTGAPATIAASLVVAREQGLNEGNVKTEYARWRKFNGVSGRIAPPEVPAAPEVPEVPAAE